MVTWNNRRSVARGRVGLVMPPAMQQGRARVLRKPGPDESRWRLEAV